MNSHPIIIVRPLPAASGPRIVVALLLCCAAPLSAVAASYYASRDRTAGRESRGAPLRLEAPIVRPAGVAVPNQHCLFRT